MNFDVEEIQRRLQRDCTKPEHIKRPKSANHTGKNTTAKNKWKARRNKK